MNETKPKPRFARRVAVHKGQGGKAPWCAEEQDELGRASLRPAAHKSALKKNYPKFIELSSSTNSCGGKVAAQQVFSW